MVLFLVSRFCWDIGSLLLPDLINQSMEKIFPFLEHRESVHITWKVFPLVCAINLQVLLYFPMLMIHGGHPSELVALLCHNEPSTLILVTWMQLCIHVAKNHRVIMTNYAVCKSTHDGPPMNIYFVTWAVSTFKILYKLAWDIQICSSGLTMAEKKKICFNDSSKNHPSKKWKLSCAILESPSLRKYARGKSELLWNSAIQVL